MGKKIFRIIFCNQDLDGLQGKMMMRRFVSGGGSMPLLSLGSSEQIFGAAIPAKRRSCCKRQSCKEMLLQEEKANPAKKESWQGPRCAASVREKRREAILLH